MSEQRAIGTLTSGTVPDRGAVQASRPAINARVSGPPVDLRLTVPGTGIPCAPVPLSIEVPSAALPGQGGVTVQLTTDPGSLLSVTFVDAQPLAGQPPVRPLTGSVRVQWRATA